MPSKNRLILNAAFAVLFGAPFLFGALPAQAQIDKGPLGFTSGTGKPTPIACAAYYYWVMSMAVDADGGKHPPAIGTLLDQYAKWAGPVINTAGQDNWGKAVSRLQLELDDARESYNMPALEAMQTLAAHYEDPCDDMAKVPAMDWKTYQDLK